MPGTANWTTPEEQALTTAQTTTTNATINGNDCDDRISVETDPTTAEHAPLRAVRPHTTPAGSCYLACEIDHDHRQNDDVANARDTN